MGEMLREDYDLEIFHQKGIAVGPSDHASKKRERAMWISTFVKVSLFLFITWLNTVLPSWYAGDHWRTSFTKFPVSLLPPARKKATVN